MPAAGRRRDAVAMDSAKISDTPAQSVGYGKLEMIGPCLVLAAIFMMVIGGSMVGPFLGPENPYLEVAIGWYMMLAGFGVFFGALALCLVGACVALVRFLTGRQRSGGVLAGLVFWNALPVATVTAIYLQH